MNHIRICNFFIFSLSIQKIKKIFNSNWGFIVGQIPNASKELFNSWVDSNLWQNKNNISLLCVCVCVCSSRKIDTIYVIFLNHHSHKHFIFTIIWSSVMNAALLRAPLCVIETPMSLNLCKSKRKPSYIYDLVHNYMYLIRSVFNYM